jgi:glycosyltransferase involved in cell wall biosynthesis
MIYQTSELALEIGALLETSPENGPVILVGNKDHDELLYWFNSADFYISASHYEGSGTALCEAMSCGCVPIVTGIPSFRTIAGNSGLYFEPGDADALFSLLKESIHRNLKDSKKTILELFRDKLSFKAISDRFQKILDSL